MERLHPEVAKSRDTLKTQIEMQWLKWVMLLSEWDLLEHNLRINIQMSHTLISEVELGIMGSNHTKRHAHNKTVRQTSS